MLDRIRMLAVACCFLSWTVTSPAAPPDAQLEAQEEEAFQQATAKVAPSVVKIETVGGLDRVSGQLVASGPTTGVVIGADGWIISSSFNFASKPDQILVTLSNGTKLPAQLVASDKSKMLSLLKVEAQGLPIPEPSPRNMLRVGQWAIALGRTLGGDSPSVSVGIISALNRIWGKAIQTDAKISPVNYGGPLIDIEGRVQGILVPLSPQGKDAIGGIEWYDSGIGFAIPLTDVLANLETLKKGKDLLPGLVGVSFKSQDELTGEVVFDRVRYDSPAQKAGFRSGDLVQELDGTKIQRISQFRQMMGAKYAGDKINLSVKRGTETVTAEITLAAELLPYEAPFLGILPHRPVTGEELPTGVRVRSIFKGSPAEVAGLKISDVLSKVNGQEVADLGQLWDRISRLRPNDSVSLSVQTGTDNPRQVDLKLARVPDEIPGELEATLIPPPKGDSTKATAEPEEKKADAKGGEPGQKPKTGLLTDKWGDQNQSYWAYVPNGYNPAHQYALVVWLHPAGDTFQAAVMKAWKSQCEERGIILLAPKALLPFGWQPNEAEFVKDLTEEFAKRYSIDRRRIVLHGMGAGGNLSYILASQEREIYRGVLTIQTPVVAAPDTDPDHRLQYFLVELSKAPNTKAIKATADKLRQQKFPVSYRALDDAPGSYPSPDAVKEFARWVDLLDRI